MSEPEVGGMRQEDYSKAGRLFQGRKIIPHLLLYTESQVTCHT